MTTFFCDIEADSLLDTATKIHCLSAKSLNGDCKTLVRYFKTFFEALIEGDTLVFHNGFGYDFALLVKLGVIKGFTPTTITLMDGEVVQVQLIDSLALSREFFPDLPNGHGLEAWSKRVGTHKPFVDDWENLPIEEYISRCEHDVISTEAVFKYLATKLEIVYE